MLLIDNILFSPVKGIHWIFKEVHKLAEEELSGESDRIRESLVELYMQLETDQITEEEFDRQESDLLDRLDTLDEDDAMIGDGDGDGDGDDDDGDEDEDEDEEQ